MALGDLVKSTLGPKVSQTKYIGIVLRAPGNEQNPSYVIPSELH